MKKILKTLALVIAAFTAGEFVTMWRMQEKPESLKEFTKSYFDTQRTTSKRVDTMYDKLAEGDREGAKEELKLIMFPERKN